MEVNLVCVTSSRTVETTQTLSQNRNRNKTKHKRLGKISKSKCTFVFFERKMFSLALSMCSQSKSTVVTSLSIASDGTSYIFTCATKFPTTYFFFNHYYIALRQFLHWTRYSKWEFEAVCDGHAHKPNIQEAKAGGLPRTQERLNYIANSILAMLEQDSVFKKINTN